MLEIQPIFSKDEAADIIRKDKAHVWHHLVQHQTFTQKDPPVFVKGQGCRVTDVSGREYLDATSGGVWCVNIGYGRETMARAIYEQLVQLPYYAAVSGTIPAAEFADRLAEFLPGLNHVYFSNSGSEANEKAIKMVRQLGRMDGGNRYKVLYRERDYHGTTIACLAATGQPERKAEYGPFPEGFASIPHALCYRCPFGKTYPDCNIECARALETVVQQEGPDEVGAVFLEPITAGGGVIPPVEEYYAIVEEICRRYGLILIIDEVVCGFGRTGTMFGFEHYDVAPDIVTMAKGMASSYAAISATAVRDELFERFLHDPTDRYAYFRDISTYGGCTGGFAAALENLRIIEQEALLDNARLAGAYLIDRLRELIGHEHVGDIRGKGLLVGIELVADRATKAPVSEAVMASVVGHIAQQGVLVGRTNRSIPGLNNTINLAPPLIVTRSDVDQIVDAVKIGIEKGCKEHFA